MLCLAKTTVSKVSLKLKQNITHSIQKILKNLLRLSVVKKAQRAYFSYLPPMVTELRCIKDSWSSKVIKNS